tara:strand:- start:427 stop:960 length:534 start_codon:yes stop_codon:yes gene_type:complete
MDLRTFFKRNLSALLTDSKNEVESNNLIEEAGAIIKSKRRELGLTKYDLAERTLITPYVIDAIENGWIEKLPEKTYLGTMLNRLEKELNITENRLTNSIKKDSKISRKTRKSFIPSVDIFYSWKGNIIYMVLMLTTLFFLNYSHRKYISMNGISLVEMNENKCSENSEDRTTQKQRR